jgi:hypothetical protein
VYTVYMFGGSGIGSGDEYMLVGEFDTREQVRDEVQRRDRILQEWTQLPEDGMLPENPLPEEVLIWEGGDIQIDWEENGVRKHAHPDTDEEMEEWVINNG